jgi:hypothetical protein
VISDIVFGIVWLFLLCYGFSDSAFDLVKTAANLFFLFSLNLPKTATNLPNRKWILIIIQLPAVNIFSWYLCRINLNQWNAGNQKSHYKWR